MSPSPSGHLRSSHALTLLLACGWACSLLPAVLGKYTPFLEQGFFFDWTPSGQTPPVPTTAQCESINIKWGRQGATGPNPTAPYFLQVFTSAFIVPFSIPVGSSALQYNWSVPFVPGTQYQICMWDANGVPGGCQATYTVYPAPNTTLQDPPVCANLTYPTQDRVLGVKGLVNNGPISQYGWIDQCTDISLTPTNGTPPYTMTVAPALHPPYNITSNTMDAINWTVSLSWGMPFFISLTDANGLSWANGPLHSGGGGPTDCLTQLDAPIESKTIKPWIAIASGAGGVAVGAIVGMLGALLFVRYCVGRRDARPDGLHRHGSNMSITTPVLGSPPLEQYRDYPTPGHHDNSREHMLPRDTSYHVEPFTLPTHHELGMRNSARSPELALTNPYDSMSTSQPMSTGHGRSPSEAQSIASPTSVVPPSISPPTSPPRTVAEEPRAPQHVYVVHHDAGRPPVTVYTADGTEVVELPPRYTDSGSGSGSVTGSSSSATGGPGRPRPLPPLRLHEGRQTGALPQKLESTESK